MPIPFPFSLPKIARSFFFICSVLLTSHARTDTTSDTANDLLEVYEEIEDDLLENNYDIPVYLESTIIKNTMRGEVFGILYHSFETVSDALKSLANWCEIMPQHLNIKACTYQHENNKCKLTFYSGRKFYQKADEVYHLQYHFNVTSLTPDYFNAFLTAKDGPLDTEDYNITVETIPLTESSTFIHFSYEYKYGFWTHIGMSTYLATLGSNKVGFTIKELDNDNNPVYIKGIRGIIERNAIRYYFAIQAYLNSLATPIDTRFETRIRDWFDMTEKYHKQLYEMDKNDYLKYKRMERQDQIRLQNTVNKSSNALALSNSPNPECTGKD